MAPSAVHKDSDCVYGIAGKGADGTNFVRCQVRIGVGDQDEDEDSVEALIEAKLHLKRLLGGVDSRKDPSILRHFTS
eukprot:NODE_29216_length_452_cov_4.058462.p2 GENE.NODE_29216_length_452_cov_4.058462~~NODE_29216_length_452_cov_4.058462.p2  ORF type:complete len:77 (-),score=12.83 NODE_29216_length_452_cov_4.058462:64-294(-)